MGILNVDNIQPVGSATTINIAADPNQVLSVGAGTSISSPATDTLALSTLSVERLRITSAGLVGLNIDNPTVAFGCDMGLHIHSTLSSGTRGAALHLTTNASGAAAGDGARIAQVDNDLMVYNHEAGGLYFGTGGNPRLQINSSGAFGLGGATYGSSGDVLTSQGSGAAPQWATAASGGWTVHSTTSASGNSEVNVTSGLSDSTTTIEIIAHRLRAGNGTAAHQVQIGTSSGWAGTYNDIQRYFVNTGSQETNRGHDQSQFSAWHGQGNPFSQDYMEFSGTFTLNKVSTGNYVMESQAIGERNDDSKQYLLINAGRVELGAALSRIRIFTSNSSNFSSGTVVIRSM